MSADNGIYILATSDKFIVEGYSIKKAPADYVAYRVAYAQGIDNFDYLKENHLHNLGHYMHKVWASSKVHSSLDAAYGEANKLSANYDYLEYGISIIDAQEFNFPEH